MSQEDVEIVRVALGAWNAGDMDAVREACDPNVIVRSIEGWPESGPFVGREAVMGWSEQLREAWDTDALEPISFTDAGDRVVVRLLWRGAGQGPESNMELTVVYALRRGKVWFFCPNRQ
jgi:ketosteroid isomerase-like protein